jgi:acyl-coenzyme A synthetase/AMP-(fatty) acid ligase
MAPTRLDIPLAGVFHDRLPTVERYAAALRFLGLKFGDVVVMALDPAAPEAIRARQACWRVGATVALWTEEFCASPPLDALLALASPTLLIGQWGRDEDLDALGERLDVEYVLTVGPEGEGSLDDFAVIAEPRFEPISGHRIHPVLLIWSEMHGGGQWRRLLLDERGAAGIVIADFAELSGFPG